MSIHRQAKLARLQIVLDYEDGLVVIYEVCLVITALTVLITLLINGEVKILPEARYLLYIVLECGS